MRTYGERADVGVRRAGACSVREAAIEVMCALLRWPAAAAQVGDDNSPLPGLNPNAFPTNTQFQV